MSWEVVDLMSASRITPEWALNPLNLAVYSSIRDDTPFPDLPFSEDTTDEESEEIEKRKRRRRKKRRSMEDEVAPTTTSVQAPTDEECGLKPAREAALEDVDHHLLPLVTRMLHIPLGVVSGFERMDVAKAFAQLANVLRATGGARAILLIAKTKATAKLWYTQFLETLDEVHVHMCTTKTEMQKVTQTLSTVQYPGVIVAAKTTLKGNGTALLWEAIRESRVVRRWDAVVSEVVTGTNMNVLPSPFRLLRDQQTEKALAVLVADDDKTPALTRQDVAKFAVSAPSLSEEEKKDSSFWLSRNRVNRAERKRRSSIYGSPAKETMNMRTKKSAAIRSPFKDRAADQSPQKASAKQKSTEPKTKDSSKKKQSPKKRARVSQNSNSEDEPLEWKTPMTSMKGAPRHRHDRASRSSSTEVFLSPRSSFSELEMEKVTARTLRLDIADDENCRDEEPMEESRKSMELYSSSLEAQKEMDKENRKEATKKIASPLVHNTAQRDSRHRKPSIVEDTSPANGATGLENSPEVLGSTAASNVEVIVISSDDDTPKQEAPPQPRIPRRKPLTPISNSRLQSGFRDFLSDNKLDKIKYLSPDVRGLSTKQRTSYNTYMRKGKVSLQLYRANSIRNEGLKAVDMFQKALNIFGDDNALLCLFLLLTSDLGLVQEKDFNVKKSPIQKRRRRRRSSEQNGNGWRSGGKKKNNLRKSPGGASGEGPNVNARRGGTRKNSGLRESSDGTPGGRPNVDARRGNVERSNSVWGSSGGSPGGRRNSDERNKSFNSRSNSRFNRFETSAAGGGRARTGNVSIRRIIPANEVIDLCDDEGGSR